MSPTERMLANQVKIIPMHAKVHPTALVVPEHN